MASSTAARSAGVMRSQAVSYPTASPYMMAERLKSSDVASLSTGSDAACRAWRTAASRNGSSPVSR